MNDLKIRIALLEMIEQFAYSYKKKEDGKEHLYTGGLSALESAFDACELDNDCCINKSLRRLLSAFFCRE